MAVLTSTIEDTGDTIDVTSFVLISILFSKMGYYVADFIVGICISLWIIYTSFKL